MKMTRTATMARTDHWSSLDPPIGVSSISARRIPEIGTSDWGLYWALDGQGQCLLILQHRAEQPRSRRLPRLRGLLVETQPVEDAPGQRLIIRLRDRDQRAVFHRFCSDIVEATQVSRSGAEAVELFLGRTWRWRRLLRSGSDGRLSREEQRGLVGELCFLERHLIPAIGPVGAIDAWTGPDDAPKDFQIGWTSVEAKSRSPHTPFIRISSADQLDASATTRLFLYVLEVSGAPGDSAAVTVTDVASRVREAIAALDASAVVQFEERLNESGLDWNDDYSDNLMLIGGESAYEVAEGFPRITPAATLPGVEDVTYSVVLSRCEDFLVDVTAMIQAMVGEPDGT